MVRVANFFIIQGQDKTAYYCVRQVVSGADGGVVQENQYYPYGSLHGESSAQALANGASAQPYKYGGKEHIALANAHLLDFTARTYDPATLSFYQSDPLQEKYPLDNSGSSAKVRVRLTENRAYTVHEKRQV